MRKRCINNEKRKGEKTEMTVHRSQEEENKQPDERTGKTKGAGLQEDKTSHEKQHQEELEEEPRRRSQQE